MANDPSSPLSTILGPSNNLAFFSWAHENRGAIGSLKVFTMDGNSAFGHVVQVTSDFIILSSDHPSEVKSGLMFFGVVIPYTAISRVDVSIQA